MYAALSRKFGLLTEELFWRYWILTKGRGSAIGLAELLDHQRPFNPAYVDYLLEQKRETYRVLDVGSGPLTHLGSAHPSLRIQVVASDFLADRYNRILASHGITPPNKTVLADAENLCDVFPRSSFDFVVANNSLDHCTNPLRAIEQIVDVLAPGSFAILRHRENEAVRARYQGLHQWNFSTDAGKPTLWNREEKVRLTEHLDGRADLKVLPEEGHVVIEIRKRLP